VLMEGERVHALTSGFLNKHTWLCVCTNRRLLFLDRGMFWGLRQIQMNLDRVQAIDSRFTIFFGSFRVWDGASAFEINLVPKSSLTAFVRTVQTAMDFYKRQMVHDIVDRAGTVKPTATPALPTPSAGTHDTSWVTELEKLSHMREAGHLSEAEYAAAKAKILASK
ncbi:MAG: hypothetical protein B7X02_00890, partial [Rhodospirillales bacterium 12-54-5]